MKSKLNASEISDREHWGALLKFSIPLIFTGILQLLFNAADIIIVGRSAENGDMALGAVGATSPLINLLVTVFMGVSVGVSVSVSRYFGADNKRAVEKSVHTAVTISIIAGIIVMIIGEIGSRHFLLWMNTPETQIDMATTYMRIYFLGVPANMIYNFCAAIVRSVGNTKTPFGILATAGFINIILNIILVIFLGMDVDGVAISTVTSQLYSAIAIIIYLIKSNDIIRLVPSKLCINKRMLLEIARIGIPAGLQSAFFSISTVIIQTAINGFGDAAVNGNTAATNIEGFVYIAMNAFYHACLTFTGQVLGAGQKHRINKILLKCLLYVILVGLILGFGAGIFLNEELLKIYLPDDKSAIARDYGYTRLFVIGITYFICGILEVLVGSTRGMGTSLTAMICVLFGACIFRIIWVEFIFPLNPELMTLYIAFPLSWTFSVLMFLGIYLINITLLKRGKPVLP